MWTSNRLTSTIKWSLTKSFSSKIKQPKSIKMKVFLLVTLLVDPLILYWKPKKIIRLRIVCLQWILALNFQLQRNILRYSWNISQKRILKFITSFEIETFNSRLGEAIIWSDKFCATKFFIKSTRQWTNFFGTRGNKLHKSSKRFCSLFRSKTSRAALRRFIHFSWYFTLYSVVNKSSIEQQYNPMSHSNEQHTCLFILRWF